MKYLFLVGTAALLLSSLSAEELVARVEMREGSPRVVVNGAVTLPRMFWGRSNGKRTPIGRDVVHFDWKLTPHAPVEKGVFIFRTAEEKGRLVVSNLTVTAECMPARQGEDALPTGSDVARASSPLRTGGPSTTVRSAPIALAAETTYTVSFDIRGEGAPWFRCGLEQQEDAVYHYHAQEVPWDDGELTSLVSQSRQALSAGCQFVTFFTANCWHDGKDDWGPYDAQFRQLIALDPKIRLIPRVTANAPAWWLRKHPECAMVFEGGVTGTYASVSSRLYRKEANAYFARLVRHLMTTYPENFAGIHFSGQNTAEWFYKDSALKLFGYDVGTRDAFRAYLASIGDPEAATAEVPTAEARHLFKDAPQCLLDAKGHRRILDFQRFLQIEMCDMVGELAETCRTASEGKKLVMAFYGYHWEHAGGCSMAPANTGHYGLMRLLEKWGKNLDVLSGPVSYAGRNPIGFAGVMSPAETIARHGILWFDEDDLRVHAADGQKAQRQYGLTENLADDRRVMMRTVGMEAARGLGGWWMDLFGGGWYSDNGTWDIARELHAFERRMMARPVRVPEVAALCDEESILNLERKRGGNVPSRGCMAVARTSLSKAGVSFGQYVLEDALAKPLGAKVEFHLSTWKPRDVAALVRQVRARPDVTRVWCWAPPAEATGFVLKPIAGTKAMVKATAAGRAAGLAESWSAETKNPIAPLYAAADAKADEIWATWPDGSAAVSVRKNPGGRGFSVFCGIPWMQQSFVSAVCRLGGVHQHLPSDRVGKAVLWAGNGFLTVQSHERATFAVDTGFAGGVRDALTGALLSQGPRAELTFEPGDVRILEDAALSSRQGEDALTTWQGRPRPCCETKASPSFVSLAARGERPSFTIVIRAEASASERYAAEELRDFTEKTTGVRLPIVTDAEPLPAQAILLGETRHTASVLGAKPDLAALGEDGFRLKAAGPHLLVLGSPVRGALYGVYELLEKYAGCRWYASWCTVTPQIDAFRVPRDLDDVQVPAFPCREPHWWDLFKSDFAARCRANGPSNRPLPRHGGNTWRFGGGLGNCHTMQRVISAAEYGKDHPEYFALHGGVRRNDPKDGEDFHVQPCLTHPDVLRIVISNVLARIRKDPSAKYYGISQNDNQLYCECERCAAVDAEEGSHAGTVVRFVNAVADAVAKEFPDVFIETLAYNYSRVPPKKTRLRPNVIPCFCSIECEFSKPLTESACPENRQLLRDILGWERQTDQLYVWDYVTDFAHYPHLFPNVDALQDNIRFFRDHHVKTLFEQGACQGRHAGFAELKAWLIAKWMWNPELPVGPLLDDFFAGYYGAGAPYVRAVFEKAHARQREAAARGEFLKIYHDVTKSPLDESFLEEAAALMDKAEAATKDDALRNYNVRMTAFGVDYMRVERMRRGNLKLVDFAGDKDVLKTWPKLQKLVRRQLARMDEAKDIRLSSGDVRNAHARKLEAWRKIANDSADGKDFTAARKGLVQDGFLTVLKPGVWANRVKDPKATDGCAIEITDVHYGWCVNFDLGQVAFRTNRAYRLSARVRVVKGKDAAAGDEAFSLGVYDNVLKKGRVGASRRVGQVTTDDYVWYDLGEWTPGASADQQYFWAASGHFDKARRTHGAATVYVDAIRFSETVDAESSPRQQGGDTSLAEAEFGKYYERVTGRKPPAGLATFAIDPKVSASGRDAYRIRSEGNGVRLVGSNSRSLLYAVYDLLARRADCSWFWDGDVVPKKAAIDFAGLDVREESQFEYRGLRYFAHRGLTRFQAEHWGFEDWKREIDWMLKNRLNLFMLRIGQDDMFQKAFPDIVPYPDPAKPVPEAMPGYNNRSLFWSLQFRGDLRKKVLAYAFARGMQCPEDFGTMSHWYSRTPYAFLEKMKPPFLPQQGGSYGHPTDRVWDVMSDPKWLDCYWRITEASIANYGRPDLLHTIGLGERRCSTNRAENTRIKIEVLKRNIAEARKRHPGSKILLAGWDFFQEWRPEEVQALFDDLDWRDLMLWDYEADATQDFRADMKGLSNNFTKWGVIGRRPYTFGIFLCLERGLDCRANYAVLEERQKAIAKDPFCKGYIFWPESSHTDTLLLDYFTANSWRAGERTIDEIRADFCRRRYGADQAARMTRGWKAVNAVAGDIGWSGNYAARSTIVPSPSEDLKERSVPTAELTKLFRPLFDDLAQVPWDTPFAVRDTIDLARTAGDRLTVAARVDLVNTWRAWRNRKASEEDVLKAADRYVALGEAMADLLDLHTDYSLWESFERLDAIEKIRLPEFEHVLVDNATCEYCRSHQAEAARYYYLPAIRLLAETIRAKVRAGDRAGYDRKALGARFTALREELLTRSLREMRPTRPRTRENFVQTLKQLSL